MADIGVVGLLAGGLLLLVVVALVVALVTSRRARESGSISASGRATQTLSSPTQTDHRAPTSSRAGPGGHPTGGTERATGSKRTRGRKGRKGRRSQPATVTGSHVTTRPGPPGRPGPEPRSAGDDTAADLGVTSPENRSLGESGDARADEEARARASVEMLARAELEAGEIRGRAALADKHAQEARQQVEAETRTMREDIRAQRLDLEKREHRVSEREERLDTEFRHLEDRAREIAERDAEVTARREQLADLEQARRLVLERAAGLTAEQARLEIVSGVENQAKRDASLVVREIERSAQEEGEARARRIITGAIQRLATEQTTESVVSVLHLPSDEMKGRIIGREGRNIRTFESVTGVNLIIDDTPEAVLLSCFDPVRREIGRVALEALILDGRIHPQRIEDAHERAKTEVEALCQRAGEDALVDVGITEMHPELVTLLGRLRYRTSYGQNVLKHLLESAHIAGMMAAELGLDPVLMKRAALLHDIGKALTHEVEGSHAIVGADVARRCGEVEDVVHAIEAHHNEVEPQTLEAVLTQAADAISGGRPGARRESLEAYVKRLERLEEIASSYDGVEKVFAMQAGREVRVMVLPDAVDDIQAQVIAREIAKQVEHELTYPGQIRVTVVRESRATEVAR